MISSLSRTVQHLGSFSQFTEYHQFFQENGIVHAILVFLLAKYYIWHYWHYFTLTVHNSFTSTFGERSRFGTILMAMLFTTFILLGRAYSSSLGSLRYFFQNAASIVQTLIWIIGYFSLIYTALSYIEVRFNKIAVQEITPARQSASQENIIVNEGNYGNNSNNGEILNEKNCNNRNHSNVNVAFRLTEDTQTPLNTQNTLLYYVIILLICWLPYYLICLPGSTEFDITTAVSRYLGQNSPDDAVPFLLTFVFGGILRIFSCVGSAGNAASSVISNASCISNENLGLFLCCTLQMIAYAFLFSYSTKTLKTSGLPNNIALCLLFLYAFIPLFPAYSITIGKDCAYGFMIILLELCIFKIIQNEDHFFSKQINKILIGTAFVLIALFRHGGILISIISALFLIFIVKNKKSKTIIFSLLSLAVLTTIVWSNIILPKLGIRKASAMAMTSIMLQQTARTVKEHEDDLNSWEIDAIDGVFGDHVYLANRYNPEIADPIMSRYKRNTSIQENKAYLKAWAYRLIHSPLSYVDAFFQKSYGYFDPNYSFRLKLKPLVLVGIHGIIASFSLYQLFPRLVMLLNALLHGLSDIPLIGIFMRCATYTWILFLSIYLLFKYGKRNYMVVYIPAVIILIGCIASPVNAYMRYMIPIVFSCPFFIGISIVARKFNSPQKVVV